MKRMYAKRYISLALILSMVFLMSSLTALAAPNYTLKKLKKGKWVKDDQNGTDSYIQDSKGQWKNLDHPNAKRTIYKISWPGAGCVRLHCQPRWKKGEYISGRIHVYDTLNDAINNRNYWWTSNKHDDMQVDKKGTCYVVVNGGKFKYSFYAAPKKSPKNYCMARAVKIKENKNVSFYNKERQVFDRWYKVYHPAAGRLAVKYIVKNYSVEIYSAKGKKVRDYANMYETRSHDPLPKGTYYIYVESYDSGYGSFKVYTQEW